jgi:hypothetical protein
MATFNFDQLVFLCGTVHSQQPSLKRTNIVPFSKTDLIQSDPFQELSK